MDRSFCEHVWWVAARLDPPSHESFAVVKVHRTSTSPARLLRPSFADVPTLPVCTMGTISLKIPCIEFHPISFLQIVGCVGWPLTDMSSGLGSPEILPSVLKQGAVDVNSLQEADDTFLLQPTPQGVKSYCIIHRTR